MEESEYKKYVALDCEITTTQGGKTEPTQVAITDIKGNKLFNEYFNLKNNPIVSMTKKREDKLRKKAKRTYDDDARNQVLDILRGKIVVGHDLKHDFMALRIDPYKDGLVGVLDTTNIILFKDPKPYIFEARKLKNLAQNFLQRKIQGKVMHNALEDAQTSANLVRTTFPHLKAPLPVSARTLRNSKLIIDYAKRLGLNKETKRLLNPHAAEFAPIAPIETQPTNVLNFFEPVKTAAKTNNLLQFGTIKSAEKYSNELAELKLGKKANNYLGNMEGLMNRNRNIDPFANVAEELGIGKPEDPFAHLMPKSVKGGNKTRRRKTRRSRRTQRRF